MLFLITLFFRKKKMAIEERKTRETEKLKRMILEATENLFHQDGYEGLSMRKIAQRIEYSPTTIYRFFKNKEDLLCAITDATYQGLSETFAEIKNIPSLSSLEKLKLLIKEYARFGLEKTDTYRLYISLSKVKIIENGIYETIGGKTYRIFASWQTFIDDLIKKDQIKSSSAISTIILIWNTVEGFIINKDNNPDLPWMSDEEEISRMVNMIFNGILMKNN